MALTKLDLYNRALFIIGERPLTSVTEDRLARIQLDEVYANGGVEFCLALARPKFALVTAKLASPTVDPAHTLDSVYALPADYIAPIAFWEDESLNTPLYRYLIEGRTVATDVATNIFLRYVSSTLTLTDFTPTFAKVVEAHLARSIAPRINPNKYASADALFKEYLEAAIALEGVKETSPLPQTTTVTLDPGLTKVYNAALSLLGEPNIRSANDNSPARVALDNAYDSGAVDYVLSIVRPKSASRAVALTVSSPSGEHGYDNVFALPADYVTMLGVFVDEDMDERSQRYFLEADTIATQVPEVYIRYISNTQSTSSWSPDFVRALAGYLAQEIAPALLSSAPWELKKLEYARLGQEFQTRVALANTLEGFQEPDKRAAPAGAVLTAEWLEVYNRALGLIRLPHLVSTDDNSERRASLDNAVNTGAVATALEETNWDFAYKSVKMTYNPSYSPAWGFSYACDLPADFFRPDQISAGPDFVYPLEYYIERGLMYSYSQEIYLRYVAQDVLTTPALWPEYFKNVVAAELAVRCGALQDADLGYAEDQKKRIKVKAKSIDVRTNPPQKIADGSWTRARGGSNRYRGRP